MKYSTANRTLNGATQQKLNSSNEADKQNIKTQNFLIPF
jgi:hypothetical protein